MKTVDNLFNYSETDSASTEQPASVSSHGGSELRRPLGPPRADRMPHGKAQPFPRARVDAVQPRQVCLAVEDEQRAPRQRHQGSRRRGRRARIGLDLLRELHHRDALAQREDRRERQVTGTVLHKSKQSGPSGKPFCLSIGDPAESNKSHQIVPVYHPSAMQSPRCTTLQHVYQQQPSARCAVVQMRRLARALHACCAPCVVGCPRPPGTRSPAHGSRPCSPRRTPRTRPRASLRQRAPPRARGTPGGARRRTPPRRARACRPTWPSGGRRRRASRALRPRRAAAPPPRRR